MPYGGITKALVSQDKGRISGLLTHWLVSTQESPALNEQQLLTWLNARPAGMCIPGHSGCTAGYPHGDGAHGHQPSSHCDQFVKVKFFRLTTEWRPCSIWAQQGSICLGQVRSYFKGTCFSVGQLLGLFWSVLTPDLQ